MEKYTRWRDPGTGVAPFLPVSAPETTAYSFVFRVLTFIVKVPLILITGLLFLFTDSFLRFSLGSFSIGAFQFLRAWTARFFLFICGFYNIPVVYDNRKARQPQGGDFVLVNQSSPIDIMILTFVYPSAVFTRCDTEMLFETQSALSAFFSRFGFSRIRKGLSINDLSSVQSSVHNRVILVFPESTTSNNRGLLAFSPIMLEKAFVMSIKYNNPAYLTSPIPHTYWNFLWALASVWSHGCRLKGSSQKVEYEFADALARLGRMPKTNLSIDDKESFLATWKAR